jgi:hypothetical protein
VSAGGTHRDQMNETHYVPPQSTGPRYNLGVIWQLCEQRLCRFEWRPPSLCHVSGCFFACANKMCLTGNEKESKWADGASSPATGAHLHKQLSTLAKSPCLSQRHLSTGVWCVRILTVVTQSAVLVPSFPVNHINKRQGSQSGNHY